MKELATLIRLHLARGPAGARQMIDGMGISQLTLSLALSALGDEVVSIGAGGAIRHAIRDTMRGLADIPIYRVDVDGWIQSLGVLVPVRPDGFVMRLYDGTSLHSDSLPWWLLDIRPQGFLGRAYAARYANALSLPDRIAEWSDTHVLRAAMTLGYDVVGDLLVGDIARDCFLNASVPAPLLQSDMGGTYVRLALAAANGELPGFSAGGEQPKFAAFAETPAGPRHVLVKFTLPDANPMTERWRDLLLAEHHALETLAVSGLDAARSSVIDHAGQRFLELERFDRNGVSGRRAVFSLASLEAEFVGGGQCAMARHRRETGTQWPPHAGVLDSCFAALRLRNLDWQHRHAQREPLVCRHTRASLRFGPGLRHAADGIRPSTER